jgi:hypothetical protein
MSVFCAEGCLTGMTVTEKNQIFRRIRRKVGAPVMGVELVDEQIEECICEAIEEYSTYINDWVLRNRLGEMLGLPSEVDFTLKYVSNSLYFENAYGSQIGEQIGLGANGTREVKTASITLTAGTQDYTIPKDREVIDILWFTPSFINLFGLDPFATSNISFSEFGASFAGHTLYHVMPVFDTIMTAQAAELRNRVRGSEYHYIVRPGPDGSKTLKLFPTPRPGGGRASANVGIGGGAGTPGTVFYTYRDRFGYYGNSNFSGNTANPGYSATTTTEQGNGLVSGPGDAKLNYINWNQLNSVAHTWIKKYAQALAKELLGIGIRGKFNGQLPIPGAELTLNKDDLISTGREDQQRLLDKLDKDLEELSYERIMEKRAMVQESVNKALSYVPMKIFIY